MPFDVVCPKRLEVRVWYEVARFSPMVRSEMLISDEVEKSVADLWCEKNIFCMVCVGVSWWHHKLTCGEVVASVV